MITTTMIMAMHPWMKVRIKKKIITHVQTITNLMTIEAKEAIETVRIEMINITDRTCNWNQT